MKLISRIVRSASRVALAVGLLCLPIFVSAKTVVYPVEAIADLWQLGATDFQSKFGGIDVTGLGLSDEGWYVRYQHENLTLLFGPLVDRETARRHAWELESVRDAAVKNRASLASSKVDFVRFTLSGRYGSRGDGNGGGEDEDGSGSARGTGDAAQQGAKGQRAGGSQGDRAQAVGGSDRGAGSEGAEGRGTGQSVADVRGGRAGREGADSAAGAAGQGPGQGERGGLQQVASLGNGQQPGAGSSGGARGASGAAGVGAGQGAQAGQPGSAASGQSAGQGSGGGAGMPAAPGAPSSGQSGGGDPLSAVLGLFRRILGL